MRLAPHMHTLISRARSAFIKTRSIHDNFLYVWGLARRLHRLRMPTLLFKLDIKKAFGTVRWDYLLDLLRRRGFPTRFRDMLSGLLRSSTSRVLLNGVPGEPIHHWQGLRQGDPLSPLLFVLAIYPYRTCSMLLHREACFTRSEAVGLVSGPPCMRTMRRCLWRLSGVTSNTSQPSLLASVRSPA